MASQEFKYFAFISYSGKDEKWAKWLHTKLEHYHIPATLCKENPNIPKKIRPVFWYKKDLSGTKLKEALEKELEVSQYLIVICSPDSAKSDWVNDEVKSFTARGRSKYIIPFIVDGVPHSANDNNECFPESLRNLPREEEIRGISVQEDGKQHALVDVVATMFGVSFDTLWQRHKRRERNIRNLWISICAFMMVCAFGIWDYTRTKVEYYADWVDCNGIAQGIIPLDDEQVNHRYYSYKFESSRVPFGEKGFYSWRLKRVSIVNSKGVISDYIPDNHDFFYPIQEYLYTDGYVTEIINRDNYNRVVMRYSISDDYNNHTACLYDLAGKDVRQESSYLSASTTAMNIGNNTDNKSKIKRFHYTRNEQGYITKVTYHANDDDNLEESAIGDNNNIYGKIYELDSLGRIIKMSYINNEGNLMTDKFGVGHIKFNYASFGGEETIEYLGNDEKLAYNEQKYAKLISRLDTFGNPIEQWYEGSDGEPCFNYKKIYRQIITFDDNGFLIEMKFLDFDGNLAYCSDNYAIQRGKYDAKGRAIERSHFDINDKPCYIKDNYSISKMKYNSNNCIVEHRCYDISGKPCVNKDNGIHMIQGEYDGDNYEISRKYYDINLNLSISPIHHCAILKITYDNYHNVAKIECFDEKGAPCFSNELFSSYTKEYDSRGNLIKEEYFDTQGKPCISKNGYASIEFKYDNYGNIIEENFWGTDKKPIYVNMYTSVQCDYYPNGKVKEIRYYNENGNLCLNDNWFAISRFEYDKNGNQIKVSYFDADTLPCIIKDGLFSYFISEYDASGNVVKETFFDTDGKVSLRDNGYAIGEYRVDNCRRIIEYAYYDENHIPCYINKEYHKVKVKYDSKGNVIQNSFYNHHNEPINHRNNNNIAEVVGYEYDERNNCICIKHMDANGKYININPAGYSIENRTFDDMGRVVEISYLNKDKEPCWNSTKTGSYSIIKHKYDQYNNITLYRYLDPQGNLTNASGAAEITVNYDDYNRIIKREYRDKFGALTPGIMYQKAIELYQYNNINLTSKISLYNSDNTLYINHIYNYDNLGRLVSTENRDSDGKLKIAQIVNMGKVPFAILRIGNDEFGNVISYNYYDENNELMNNKDGYATEKWTYDKYGRIVTDELFDKDGKAAFSAIQGWHKSFGIYNDKGLIIEISYFDINGKYVNVTSGAITGGCKIEYIYDEKGKTINSIGYEAQNGNVQKIIYPEYDKTIKRKANGSLVVGQVQMPGLFQDRGYMGTYFIIVLNEWNIYDDLIKFGEALVTSAENERRIVMVPWEDKEDGRYELGNLIDITLPAGVLGVRFMDISDHNDIFNELVDTYEAYKKQL